MHLRHVSIANFRALKEFQLRLRPDSTILVGENQWGRTSLLLALERALGADAAAVTEQDRTRGSTGPISIGLDVGESTPGEFSAIAALAGLSCQLFGRPVLRVRLSHEGGKSTTEVLDPDGAPLAVDPSRAEAALAVLRSSHPAIRISLANGGQGALAGQYGDEVLERIVNSGRPADHAPGGLREELLARARQAADSISQRRLKDAAALDVVAELRSLQSPGAAGGRRVSADRVCALLIAAHALLRADRRGAGDGVRPLILLEDPETHLHPTLLSNLWALIEDMPAQRLVTTYSSEFLGAVDLRSIRRVVRRGGRTTAHGIKSADLSESDARRLSYHVRTLRGAAFFARAWILVEGETEFWTVPGAASLLGHELDGEGVRVVEFAQAGLESVLKLAECLAMPCHTLVDGDAAGRGYAEIVSRHESSIPCRLTVLPAPNIERFFWEHGFDRDIITAAYGNEAIGHRSPGRAIEDAIRRHTKPGLARRLLDAMAKDPNRLIPVELGQVIASAVSLARQSQGA